MPPRLQLPPVSSGPGSPNGDAALQAGWELREESFRHGAFAVGLLLPRSADELIDEEAFDADERLPYWADLWPSARALAHFLVDSPSVPGRALELGCGAAALASRALELGCGAAALASLALAWRGASVTASDYDTAALRFAAANARRNRLPLTPAELDWRRIPDEFGTFEQVTAADVMYERRNAEALAAALPRLVSPGGIFLLADPGRAYTREFRAWMLESGWHEAEVAAREEQAAPGAPPVRVRVTEWRRVE